MLNKIKPTAKEIIMATIIDTNIFKKATQLTDKDITDYLLDGDFLPLIYGNTQNKNIIYLKQISGKGKKKL